MSTEPSTADFMSAHIETLEAEVARLNGVISETQNELEYWKGRRAFDAHCSYCGEVAHNAGSAEEALRIAHEHGLTCPKDPRVTYAGEATQVLEAMVAEYTDYAIRNHLGNPEKQHNIKWARTVLAKNPNPAGLGQAPEASQEADAVSGAGTVTFEAQSTVALGTVCGTTLRHETGKEPDYAALVTKADAMFPETWERLHDASEGWEDDEAMARDFFTDGVAKGATLRHQSGTKSSHTMERTPGLCTCGMGPISGCWKCEDDSQSVACTKQEDA